MASERRWTEEQLSAINTRGKTLLVSAAAGSGKTATLTERIIRSLLDKERPATIDSLLIVTYTNAAASELRSKIAAALEVAVKQNPGDEELMRQLMMLPSAKIKTIDAFCNDLLKSNVDRVGLSPRYRISTGAECEILSNSILEGLIDSVYSDTSQEIATAEEFEALAECLTDTKHTEELAEVLKFVYDKCQSSLEGTEILVRLTDIYDPEKYECAEKTPHGKYLMEKLDSAADHYIAVLKKYSRLLDSDDVKEGVYTALIELDISELEKIRSAAGYPGKRNAMEELSFAKMKSVRDKSAVMEEFSALRKIMRDDILEYKKLFIYTEKEWRELYSSLHAVLSTLCKFLLTFDRIFIEEKRNRGIVSYADLERYTYKCLWENGERTDIAKNLQNQFSEIYIDEYQDVNALQDKIFEAIARSDNRFMVGDIKQSIYGFRSARPEIFAEMKASFPPLSEADGECASVFMSSNFRCDKGIVDFTNEIFDKMFTVIGKSIGYRDGDRLGYAKIHNTEPPYQRPVVVIAPKGQYMEDGDISAEEAVALKIKELLNEGSLDSGEKPKCSDIALIFRTTKSLERYADALARHGIPTEISVPEEFFLTPEVLLVLSFLNTVDNPRRDIYLAGILCSPLFGFSGSELAQIRLSHPKDTLYESLLGYTDENPDFAKGREFLSTLNYYRSIAEGVGVDKLIHKIYYETGLLALASRHGGRKNLMFLYDHARSFESGAFKGLYNFITYIDNVISGKITAEFDEKRGGEGKGAVKLITAHSSKGLEYPIVFFVGANKKMAGMTGGVDSKERWISYSERLGVSLKLRTPSGLARVNNPVSYAISEYSKEKDFEEELRVLYVILTRAREQLYIVGESPKKDIEEYREYIGLMSENLTEYSARGLATYLDVILAGCGSRGVDSADFAKNNEPDEKPVQQEEESSDTENGLLLSESFGDLKELLVSRFGYKYPELHMSSLPEKMAVSAVRPDALDGMSDTVVEMFINEELEEEERYTLPKFMSGTDAEESAKRGIATHYFMQFCDLESFIEHGAKKELERLLSFGYISHEDGKRVRIAELEEYRCSPLLREMLGAKNLYRELRFNVRLPAEYFTEDEEKKKLYSGKHVLVQGVIDCIIESRDGEYHLIDYKTDRLTRAERQALTLAEEKMRDKHTLQLSYYALAIKEIFGKLPNKISVYSLHLGKEIEIYNRFS